MVTQNQCVFLFCSEVLCFVFYKDLVLSNDLILRQIGHRKELAKLKLTSSAWFAQLGERRSAKRKVADSNPGRTNTQGLQ